MFVRKSDVTHGRILQHGLALVSIDGFDGVTIGGLAKRAGLSKSGLYAHFGSVEALQLELLRAAAELAGREVLEPAMDAPPGLPRIRRLFDRLLGWAPRAGLPGGCPFVAASAEFDDTEGPVRDYLVATLEGWLGFFRGLVREAVDEGQLCPDVDANGFAWQIFGLYTMHHTAQRLMQDPDADRMALGAFEGLICSAQHDP